MGVKRIVDTSFWTDGKVDDFSPEDKYFMLYLLTNPFSTQLGIYEISIKQVAFQLGYSVDAVKVLLDRFETKYKMILFSPSTNEIAIKNFLRHSIIKGGAPVRDCLIKEMKAVKNKDLISRVFAHIKDSESLNATVKQLIADYEKKNGSLSYSNEKHNENENENDNDNDNEVSSPVSGNDTSNDTLAAILPGLCRAIVQYLNQRAGTDHKPDIPTTVDLIKAKLQAGFTVVDFEKVIDKKCADWMGTEFEQYLRPSTLFGDKFEGYLKANPRAGREQIPGWFGQRGQNGAGEPMTPETKAEADRLKELFNSW